MALLKHFVGREMISIYLETTSPEIIPSCKIDQINQKGLFYKGTRLSEGYSQSKRILTHPIRRMEPAISPYQAAWEICVTPFGINAGFFYNFVHVSDSGPDSLL